LLSTKEKRRQQKLINDISKDLPLSVKARMIRQAIGHLVTGAPSDVGGGKKQKVSGNSKEFIMVVGVQMDLNISDADSHIGLANAKYKDAIKQGLKVLRSFQREF
jgi:hypothetical protein